MLLAQARTSQGRRAANVCLLISLDRPDLRATPLPAKIPKVFPWIFFNFVTTQG
jgi:hypothetical protein